MVLTATVAEIFGGQTNSSILVVLMCCLEVYTVIIMCCSSMLAVALDDFTVTVVDIDTRRTVRVFTGHLNTVTGMVGYLGHSGSYRTLLTVCVMSFLA